MKRKLDINRLDKLFRGIVVLSMILGLPLSFWFYVEYKDAEQQKRDICYQVNDDRGMQICFDYYDTEATESKKRMIISIFFGAGLPALYLIANYIFPKKEEEKDQSSSAP